jgi:sugar lactone lactonase YvrE
VNDYDVLGYPRRDFLRGFIVIVLGLVVSRCATTSASDLAPGDLVVSETRNANAQGLILDIDPVTGQQQVLASGGNIVQPNGLCFDSAGNIVVADFGFSNPGAIVRIDRITHQQTEITSGGNLSRPTGVALLSGGQLIVGEQGLGGAVLRINLDTGSQTVLASNLGVVEDVVLDSDLLVLTDTFQNPGRVYRVDPVLGTTTVVSSGGLFNFGPHGICLNKFKLNSLLVTEAETNPSIGSLLDVNTITGAQTRVSLGGNLIRPTDVAQDPSGITYVTDAGLSGSPRGLVMRVDLQNGTQTIVASGGNLLTPLGIMVVPEPTLGLLFISTFLCTRRRGGVASR